MWVTKATYWLENDGSFAEGIALLQEKGISTRQMEPRSRKHLVTPQMKEQVRNQVERLLEANQGPPGEIHPQPPRPPDTPPEKEPQEIEKLRDRGKRLMKQRSRLHAMLSTATSDEERYDIAREMCIEVQPKIDQVYLAIRDWENSGAIPSSADQDEIVAATVQKMLRRKSLSVRLSQLRRKLKQPGIEAGQRKQHEAELAEKTDELEALEAELGL